MIEESSHEKRYFIETELKNWEDIFKLDQRFLINFIYRGQHNSSWDLSTSFERTFRKNVHFNIDKRLISLQEREMIKEFQWKYPLYASVVPDKNDYFEWLSLMQHFGASTRLLDFTQSILIAMYFAVFGSNTESAIWALNKEPITSEIFTIYRERKKLKQASMEDLNKISIQLANESIYSNEKDLSIEKQLFYIKPKICNERITKQQGLFVMQSDIKCTFSECLEKYKNPTKLFELDFNDLIEYSREESFKSNRYFLIKIRIPDKLSSKIIRNLRAMNITSEILFPGIEGLAKSLNYFKLGFNMEI